jgi:hypothetical protein
MQADELAGQFIEMVVTGIVPILFAPVQWARGCVPRSFHITLPSECLPR